MSFDSICIFCGSRPGNDPIFMGTFTGRIIGKLKKHLYLALVMLALWEKRHARHKSWRKSDRYCA